MAGKDEEIKIRVPGAMKRAIKRVADGRFTSESEIAREALLEYLRNRDIALRDEDVAPPTPPVVPSEPVSYTKGKSKKASSAQVAAAEKKIVEAIQEEVEKVKKDLKTGKSTPPKTPK